MNSDRWWLDHLRQLRNSKPRSFSISIRDPSVARAIGRRKTIFFFFEHRESIAEPSSRDPMVESTTSGSSSDTNEPVCAQLLTQLNTAYQHLAPDAQALVSSVLWKFTYSWKFFAASVRDSVSRDELDRTDTARSWKSVGVVILVQLSRV